MAFHDSSDLRMLVLFNDKNDNRTSAGQLLFIGYKIQQKIVSKLWISLNSSHINFCLLFQSSKLFNYNFSVNWNVLYLGALIIQIKNVVDVVDEAN